MKNDIKRFIIFIIVGIVVVLIYIFSIYVYTKISNDPIIFFASILISFFVSVTSGILLYIFGKQLFMGFTVFSCVLAYFFGLLLFITFGPVFIDRSISYHLAFYATEEEAFFVDEIRNEFSNDIFEKRIHDAVSTGFLVANADGSYSPAAKAKLMTAVLMPLGKMTGALETYKSMKEALKK